MNKYKIEIDRLNNELHDLKHKVFEQKKKEAFTKEKELQWLTESGLACIQNAYSEGVENIVDNKKGNESKSPHRHRVRFVGGGFAVK